MKTMKSLMLKTKFAKIVKKTCILYMVTTICITNCLCTPKTKNENNFISNISSSTTTTYFSNELTNAIAGGYFIYIPESNNSPINIYEFCYAVLSTTYTTYTAEELQKEINSLCDLYIKLNFIPKSEYINTIDALSFIYRAWQIQNKIKNDESLPIKNNIINQLKANNLISDEITSKLYEPITYEIMAEIISNKQNINNLKSDTKTEKINQEEQNELYTKIKNRFDYNEIVEFFDDIALDSEYADENETEHNIVRWTTPVITYSIIGDNINEEILNTIKNVLYEIEKIPNTPYFEYDTTGNGLLKIEIGTEQAKKYLDDYYANGFCNIAYDNTLGRIINGYAYFKTEYENSTEMKHAVLEELVQLMGLANDSMKYTDSIFYTNYSSVTTLSDIDKLMLELLYSDSIKPNMLPNDAKTTIANWLTENIYK